jgi:ABC-2 type transport system ATP-binding protein
MKGMVLEVRHLQVRREGRVLLHDLSFEVAPGEVLALLGPNGSGKSTLLAALEGLLPSRGILRICGRDPRRDHRARSCFGAQLQEGSLYPELTPLELMRLFAALHRVPAKSPELLDHLGAFGLSGVARQPTRFLSVGQRQRLSLALALLHQPRLLFLDEPTAPLDPQGRREFWGLLQERKEQAILLATHSLEEAQTLGHRLAILYRGQLLALDTPERLLHRFDTHQLETLYLNLIQEGTTR